MNQRLLVHSKPIMAAILALYLLVGGLYVFMTPIWQAPDEPAHYNYIAHIAEQGRLPVLRDGDFPTRYLDELKGKGFPDDMSVETIRYESWQPPLYYLLCTPIYLIARSAPLAVQVRVLRVFSLLVGSGLLWLTFRLVQEILPRRPSLALAATTFLVAVPMHVAMLSAINNDGLTEVLITAVLLCVTLLIKHGPSPRRLALLGVLMGSCLLTKNTAAISLPVAALGIWIATRRVSRSPAVGGRNLGIAFGTALLISLGWYVRNAAIYGWSDPLIWKRHGEVVAGQLTTAQYLRWHDWAQWLGDLAQTTFHSFWGQFGWMAVPMNQRVYLPLWAISAMATLGVLFASLRLWRIRRRGQWEDSPITWEEMQMLSPLALSLALTIGLFLWYNRQFVQFQGRYLFPAIAPLGLAFVIGLSEVLKPGHAKLIAIMLGLGAWTLLGAGMDAAAVDTLSLSWMAAGCLAFLGKRFVPPKYDPWLIAAVFGGLLLLSALAPTAYISPFLGPAS